MPRMGGVLPGTDRAEGVLGSGTRLHKGLGAGPEARRDEEVEAKNRGRVGRGLRYQTPTFVLNRGQTGAMKVAEQGSDKVRAAC